MTSHLFEDVLGRYSHDVKVGPQRTTKLDRVLGTEEEELEEAMSNFERGLEGNDFDGPNGMKIRFTHRGFKEFFDAVSRVMGGGVRDRWSGRLPGASNLISRFDSDKMEYLLASVEKLPSLLRNMSLKQSDRNEKRDKKPDVMGYDHYEAPIVINGKKLIANITVEDREDSDDYYYHFLHESIRRPTTSVVGFELREI
jgi:hypothetical protein